MGAIYGVSPGSLTPPLAAQDGTSLDLPTGGLGHLRERVH
jgi:hypothetical protein